MNNWNQNNPYNNAGNFGGGRNQGGYRGSFNQQVCQCPVLNARGGPRGVPAPAQD